MTGHESGLHEAVEALASELQAGTLRFMADYEKAGEGMARRISGETAALIVQEREVLTADLRDLLAAHPAPVPAATLTEGEHAVTFHDDGLGLVWSCSCRATGSGATLRTARAGLDHILAARQPATVDAETLVELVATHTPDLVQLAADGVSEGQHWYCVECGVLLGVQNGAEHVAQVIASAVVPAPEGETPSIRKPNRTRRGAVIAATREVYPPAPEGGTTEGGERRG